MWLVAHVREPGPLEQLAQLRVGAEVGRPRGDAGGGRRTGRRDGVDEHPEQPVRPTASPRWRARPSRPAAAPGAPPQSASSGRPTWLNTKLPTTASNVPGPAGIASNDPTRNGIEGLAIAARRTIDGATSMPTVSAPSAAAAAASSPGPEPTSRTWQPSRTSAAPSTVPPTRRVIGERKPYDPARSSQPAASKRVERLGVDDGGAAPGADPSAPSPTC